MLISATLKLTETGAKPPKSSTIPAGAKLQVRTFDAETYAGATDYTDTSDGGGYVGKYITPFVSASGEPIAVTTEDVTASDGTDLPMTVKLTDLTAVGTLTLRIDASTDKFTDATIYDAAADAAKVPTLTDVVLTDAPEMSTVIIKYQKESGGDLSPEDGRATSAQVPQGTKYEATNDMKADFTVDGVKYTLSDTSDTSVTPDGPTAELVLKFKEAQKKTIQLKSKVGEAETVMDTKENVYVGDTITFVWPKYLAGDDKKVTATCNRTTYSKDITVAADTADEVVEYTAVDDGAVKYYVEVEDLGAPYGKKSSTNQFGANLSKKYGSGVQGEASKANKAPVFTIPEDGKYKVTVCSCTANATKSAKLAAFKNEAPFTENTLIAATTITKTISGPVDTAADTKDFKKGDTIILYDDPSGDQGRLIVDYVLIEKEDGAISDLPTQTKSNIVTSDPADDDVKDTPTSGVVPTEHNFGSSFANKSASDLGTFTVADDGGVLKITGTAKKVDLENEKGEQYYIPVRITLPKSGIYESAAPQANTGVLLWQWAVSAPTTWTANGDTIKDFSNQFKVTGEFDKAYAADILLRCDKLPYTNGAESPQNYKAYFKLDLDGAGANYAPTLITVDISGVTAAE